MYRGLIRVFAWCLLAAVGAASARADEAETKEFIQAVQKCTDEELADILRNYLFDYHGDAFSLARAGLRSVRERVTPLLVKMLADPALREKFITPQYSTSLPDIPFERACDLAGAGRWNDSKAEAVPAELAPVLVGFLDVPKSMVPSQAAYALGKIGKAGAIPGVRKALGDSRVCGAAMRGLLEAYEAKRLDAGVRDALFDALQGCLASDDLTHVNDAVRLMLKLYGERAVTGFASPDLLSAENMNLRRLLYALTETDVKIPRERLMTVVETLERRDLSQLVNGYELGLALQLLGRHRDPQDRFRIEEYTSHGNRSLAVLSCRGLAAWHGVEKIGPRIDAIVAERGFEALTAEQRRFKLITTFDNSVQGAGFYGFFLNHEPAQVQETFEALEALGLGERAALLGEALLKLPNGKPAIDRAERTAQLEALLEGRTFNENNPFQSLDSRYRAIAGHPDSILLDYVLKHREEFR